MLEHIKKLDERINYCLDNNLDVSIFDLKDYCNSIQMYDYCFFEERHARDFGPHRVPDYGISIREAYKAKYKKEIDLDSKVEDINIIAKRLGLMDY